MIKLSETVAAVLSQPSIESFNLVRFGGLYKTDFYRDIVFNGNTYLSDGTLKAVEPPQVSSSLDKVSFKVIFSDPAFDFSTMTYLDTGGQTRSILGSIGQTLEVRVCFVDQSISQPMLNIDDTILAYSGRSDSTTYNVTTEASGEVLFSVTGTSPMADLDLTRAFYTSQDFSNKYFPGDTSYEQVFEGSNPVNLRWGKK